jgi:hypothetical protein
MKRSAICILAIMILAGTASAWALDGQVVTVNGKVEYQDAKGTWKPMKAGDPVIAGTMISTGFKSDATVKLGASILTIRPLTRMTLSQLVEKEDTVDTELYLEVGNVKAEVNSLNNKKNGFSVKSPVATASVRGTVFEVSVDEIVVLEGTVVVETSLGQTRSAEVGQTLKIVDKSVASPATAAQTDLATIKLSDTPSTEVTSTITATSPVATVPDTVVPAAPPAVQPKATTEVVVQIN